jgi:hypothetical protein
MSQNSSGDDHGPGHYEIRLQGHLGRRWAAWFDDMTVANESDGTTVLRGYVVDQSALHGLLHKVRDIGLPLVSVVRLDADQSPPPSPRKARP